MFRPSIRYSDEVNDLAEKKQLFGVASIADGCAAHRTNDNIFEAGMKLMRKATEDSKHIYEVILDEPGGITHTFYFLGENRQEVEARLHELPDNLSHPRYRNCGDDDDGC